VAVTPAINVPLHVIPVQAAQQLALVTVQHVKVQTLMTAGHVMPTSSLTDTHQAPALPVLPATTPSSTTSQLSAPAPLEHSGTKSQDLVIDVTTPAQLAMMQQTQDVLHALTTTSSSQEPDFVVQAAPQAMMDPMANALLPPPQHGHLI